MEILKIIISKIRRLVPKKIISCEDCGGHGRFIGMYNAENICETCGGDGKVTK